MKYRIPIWKWTLCSALLAVPAGIVFALPGGFIVIVGMLISIPFGGSSSPGINVDDPPFFLNPPHVVEVMMYPGDVCADCFLFIWGKGDGWLATCLVFAALGFPYVCFFSFLIFTSLGFTNWNRQNR